MTTENDLVPSPEHSGRLPGVLLIGAMKAGTTTLHELLAQHPKLFMTPAKEPAFFSRPDRFALGLDWYRNLFADAVGDQMCGESSTCYSRWPYHGDVAGKVAEVLPNAKLVYLLRHPVDRMFSHYRHRMTERFARHTGPVLSFEEAIVDDPEIRDASLYAAQAERYLLHYPRERLLLLLTDDLERDPAGTAMKVHTFLGFEALAPADLSTQNEFAKRFGRNNQRRRMGALKATRIGSLARGMVPKFARPALGRAVERALARIPDPRKRHFERVVSVFKNETRQRLLDEFREPNARLEELLGAPLPESWQR